MSGIFQSLGSVRDGRELPGCCLQERQEPGHHLCDVHGHGLSVLQVSQRHPASLRLSHRTHRVLQRAGCTHGRGHCGQVQLYIFCVYCDTEAEKNVRIESWFLTVCCRAAARCNKGIEVLLAVALEHFVLVVVRVLRGPTQADESAKKLRKLVHCQWCEERVFLKQGNMVDGESVVLVMWVSASSFVHTDAGEANPGWRFGFGLVYWQYSKIFLKIQYSKLDL